MTVCSWNVGNVSIPNQLVLAPMEGVNCASFRVMCKRAGAGLIYTDMVDTKQFLEILKENRDDEPATVEQVINPHADERPLAIQLGSGNVEDLAHVTQIVRKHADIIDFNLGCPLPDMLGRKGGTYLMKHPEQLERLLPSLLDNAGTCPISAKIRSGWCGKTINAVKIAQLLERQGVAAIAIHPRTKEQKYRDRADWNLIKQVKEAVRIPVIGNGDLLKPANTVTMLGQTGCDAVMIGRGAIGNPEFFSQALLALDGKRYEERTRAHIKKSFNVFLQLYEERELRSKLSELQDHAGWWMKGLMDAAPLKKKIRACKTKEQLSRVMNAL